METGTAIDTAAIVTNSPIQNEERFCVSFGWLSTTTAVFGFSSPSSSSPIILRPALREALLSFLLMADLVVAVVLTFDVERSVVECSQESNDNGCLSLG